MADFIPVNVHNLPKLAHLDGPIHLLDVQVHIFLDGVNFLGHLSQPLFFLFYSPDSSHPGLSMLAYLQFILLIDLVKNLLSLLLYIRFQLGKSAVCC
jgi:hypothetical protein